MIKRHALLSKKNTKKAEVEQTVKLIRQQIEATLKKLNRRNAIDYLDLKDLKPNFLFKLPDDLKTLVSHFKKIVDDFVAVNNEYVKTKINEEKAKAKKPRLNDDKFDQQLKDKYETLNYKAEMSRIVKELVKGLPETIQPIMESKHLNFIFGLDTRSKPVPGNLWNKIVVFPNTYPVQRSQGGSAGQTQGGQVIRGPGMQGQMPIQQVQNANTPNKFTTN